MYEGQKTPEAFCKIQHPKKRAFLAAMAELGNISAAANAAEISRDIHYVWMSEDVDYSEAFGIAKEMSIDALEHAARGRAIKGIDKPVYQGGKKVGYVREYSDGLLMFLLNGERPNKFKYRHEHSGPNNGPITVATIDLTSVNDDELQKELRKIEQLTTGINAAAAAGEKAADQT